MITAARSICAAIIVCAAAKYWMAPDPVPFWLLLTLAFVAGLAVEKRGN